jgi:quinol-cytochrome oxidoreductase complex cytochrome b subunit
MSVRSVPGRTAKLYRSARIFAWLDERLGLSSIGALVAHKTVPFHSGTLWYYFGGVTLFLFAIQVATGILLLLYYRPTSTEAYESVQFIMTRVEFGWLVRSVHSWSANLMILSAFVHMFSVAFLRAYRRPRELTWLSGVALLALALAFGFSGYLLPWNTVSYFATKVGTDMAASVPVIGPALARFLRGGDDVGGATLTRFFGFHVAVLPAVTTLLVIVHLALVQKAGISSPPWIERRHAASGGPTPQMPFFPNFFLRELTAWYGALGVLGCLAALFPWELGEKADPFAPAPAGIRPEWYFLAPFYTLKLIPSHVWVIEGELLGLLGFGLLAAFWVLLPFWGTDRAGVERTRLVTGAGVVLIAYLVTFSILGYFR